MAFDPISAVLAVVSVGSQIKAIRDQKEIAEEQQELAQGQAAEERRRKTVEQIRKRRIATAQAVAQATASGVQDSSSLEGTVAGIQSQTASNIGNISQDFGFEMRRQRLIKKQGNIETTKAVGDIAGSIFQQQGGFKSIFK